MHLNEKMYLVGTYYLGLADTNEKAEIKNREPKKPM